MKPLDKKDMPKLLALVGLTVCSLSYGIYTLVAGVSYGQPAPPSKQEEKKDPHAPGAAPELPAVAENTMMSQLKTLEQVSDPLLVRDPFVTGVVPGTGASPAPSVAPPTLPLARGVLPGVPQTDPVADKRTRDLARALGVEVTLKPGSPALVINEITPAPVPVLVIPSPAPPTLEVSGVVISENGRVRLKQLLDVQFDFQRVN